VELSPLDGYFIFAFSEMVRGSYTYAVEIIGQLLSNDKKAESPGNFFTELIDAWLLGR